MSRSIDILVYSGTNLVDGAHVSINDLLGVLVTSGTTDVHGALTLNVPNDGSYVGIGTKVISLDTYADAEVFTTDPLNTTNLALHLVLV